MARKLGNFWDFAQNEARNLRHHILASAPSSPVTGQVYYNSGDNNLYLWDGSGWVDLTVQGSTYTAGAGLALSGSDFSVNVDDSSIEINADTLRVKAAGITNAMLAGSIQLSKLATDPLARANHTGTQTASTISDFDTQVRTSRLDQMASPSASVSANSQKITNLADGTANSDAANWGQVQSLVQGVRYLAARLASAGASVSESGATATTLPVGGASLSIDGVAVVNGDTVLLKDQTTPARNGLYVVSGVGTSVLLTRDSRMDTAAEIDGKVFIIEDGNTLAGTMWITVSDVTTLGTDAISITQFNKATDITGGSGLTLSGLDLSVNVDNSSIEINADTLRVKAAGVTNAMLAGSIAYSKLSLTNSIVEADLADDSVNLSDSNGTITGTTGIGNGGTGQTTAKAARETGLGAAGFYSTATHSAGTTITIAQATHGLRSQKGLYVQTFDEATGDMRLDDISIASSGDVTITFSASQSANSVRVTIIG